jgi:hypothetical protein
MVDSIEQQAWPTHMERWILIEEEIQYTGLVSLLILPRACCFIRLHLQEVIRIIAECAESMSLDIHQFSIRWENRIGRRDQTYGIHVGASNE